MKNLMDLFQELIRDIYSSEQQLLKAMPQMQSKAENARLKEAIENHIGQTREHVRRIEQLAEMLQFEPGGTTCQGTVGLIKEAQELLEDFGGTPAGDAAIIACAQKNEHYEIANYGTAITWAEEMDVQQEAIDLLEETLQEEEVTDDILSAIAEEEVNPQAVEAWGETKSSKATLM